MANYKKFSLRTRQQPSPRIQEMMNVFESGSLSAGSEPRKAKFLELNNSTLEKNTKYTKNAKHTKYTKNKNSRKKKKESRKKEKNNIFQKDISFSKISFNIEKFEIPVSKHTAEAVLRLFKEQQKCYKILSIQGERIEPVSKIDFIEKCYGNINMHLGISKNIFADLCEIDPMIKNNQNRKNSSMAQRIMGTLTMGHFANVVIHILPKWFPELFDRTRENQKYIAKFTSNGINGEYAIWINNDSVHTMQRKQATLYKGNSTLGTFWIELHSKINRNKNTILGLNWIGKVKILIPILFDFDIKDEDKEYITKLFLNLKMKKMKE